MATWSEAWPPCRRSGELPRRRCRNSEKDAEEKWARSSKFGNLPGVPTRWKLREIDIPKSIGWGLCIFNTCLSGFRRCMKMHMLHTVYRPVQSRTAVQTLGPFLRCWLWLCWGNRAFTFAFCRQKAVDRPFCRRQGAGSSAGSAGDQIFCKSSSGFSGWMEMEMVCGWRCLLKV